MAKDTHKQSPHWVDQVVNEIFDWQKAEKIEKLHVDDMKTPSGRVHTGALRGVMIHDIVAKVIQSKSTSTVTSTYVFNDFDSMDGLPKYLDQEEYSQHMGKPLFQIPTPDLEESGVDFSKASEEEKRRFKNARSFAEFYALDFIEAFRKLGCTQEILWSHELYQSGQMDGIIRITLDNVDKFRKIYKEVADYVLPEKWYPFQPVCERCGKVGTTLTTGWNGEKISYECQPNKVEWAQGCGHKGQVSPFGGTGKLLWKVDWPAHWNVMGVNVEGAGKDHTSAGGSRDMADAICREVFDQVVPFDIPYEWILLRGSKMSSSKGVGTSAREFVELFPAEVGRFLFVSRNYYQVIDFDPSTMAIPDLFDEYDAAAKVFWGMMGEDQRLARSFELAQIGEMPPAHFLPRFRDVALWMQHPEIVLEEKFAEVKGSALTELEKEVLSERQRYAEVWVKRYAPEEFQLRAKETLPEAAKELSTEQVEYLSQVITLIDSRESWEPQDLQQELFELAKATVGPKPAFQAIYKAFLGKTAGPRAAWFLLSIDKGLRLSRIQELKAV
ncbi:MAG: lysine--tRNA ligase [Patescibacteria group bacterium]